jgi:hypothetical protein
MTDLVESIIAAAALLSEPPIVLAANKVVPLIYDSRRTTAG